MINEDDNLNGDSRSFPSKIHHLISQCHRIISESVKALSDDLLVNLEGKLDTNIDKAANNQEYLTAFEDFRILHENKQKIADEICLQIGNGFTLFKEKKLATFIRDREFQNGTWVLVDDNVLEESIAINSFASNMNVRYKKGLWQLNQRFSVLNDNTPIDEHNNPLSPVQFGVALRSALALLPIEITIKLAAYKALSEVTNQYYREMLEGVNNYLISEDILPDLNYQKSVAEKMSARDQAIMDVTNDFESSIAEIDKPDSQQKASGVKLMDAIRGLLKKVRPSKGQIETVSTDEQGEGASSPQHSTDEGGYQQTEIVFTDKQIVETVAQVQNSAATAHFFSEVGKDVVVQTPTNVSENSAQIYEQLRQMSPGGAINAKNMYTIDMVGMIFEYILTDENLPDSIKTLLSHLHTPFLKLAFIDPHFFEEEEHESRLLLDSLAEAGTNWVSHDGTSQYDIYNEIKKVVQRIVKTFKNDVELFSELLVEFNLLKKRVAHMHALKERNSVEKKQGQEKLKQAKMHARLEIKKRIEGRHIPSAMIPLLSPWFAYLTFVYLRADTQQWEQALQVIDNLLIYSFVDKSKPEDIHLSQNFDQLINEVEIGLETIVYNQAKTTEVLSALEKLKQCILERRLVKTTSAPVESKEELALQEAADMEALDNSEPTEEEEKVMNYLRLIEPGTWVECDDQTRLKVNGFNSESLKYILVDQTSQEVTLLSRLAFAQHIISGKIKITTGSNKPLFDRALERIYHDLEQKTQDPD